MGSPAPYDAYELGLMPTWLQGPYGERWATGVGIMKDAMVEGTIAAVKCRWAKTCPEDALQYIGQERLMPQIPGETAAAYRTRLQAAWLLWPFAGTKQGILTALSQLGFTNSTIKENADWTYPPSPGFSTGQEWWRFWIIIDQPNGFGPPLWRIGDGTNVGSGKTIGFSYSPQTYPMIRPTVALWKPAHALLVNIVVIISGSIVGGDWHIGDGTVVGGQAALI